jgi:hypothetical protein
VPERWLAGFVAFVLFAFAAGAARAESAEITQMRFDRTEDGLVMSANVTFELPPAVEDALTKGIPMFFVAEAVLLRDRWYWTDKHVATTTRHMRLSYQPLTRRWRLNMSSSPIGSAGVALGQNFDTRDEALAAIQRISHWKIAESADIDPEARYNVNFRFRLDVSQLPRPFQIGAVGHSDWTINVSRNVRLLFETPR